MSSLFKINPNCAGIDIGNESVFVGIEDCDVTSFGTFTDDYINLIAETGTNLQKHWMTEKHFSSWAALSPNMHQSGKTNKKRKIKKNSRAGQIFREAALSIAASEHSGLSAFYKLMKAKKGFLHALKATARKIAVLYYRIMTKGLAFVEHGIQLYQQKLKEQQLRLLRKKAHSFGLQLVLG